MRKRNEHVAGDTSTVRAPEAGALVQGHTPISRALFAELQGVDTRSVNKIKWDQIIRSHLKLELDRADLLAALERISKLYPNELPDGRQWTAAHCLGVAKEIADAAIAKAKP